MPWSWYSKQVGKQAEELVKQDYLWQWCQHIASNWTIVGGELDLIMQDAQNHLIIVEVKCVDHTDDLMWYIGRKKLSTLKRSIEYYCSQTPLSYTSVRLDIVFVKHGQIYEIFENIAF